MATVNPYDTETENYSPTIINNPNSSTTEKANTMEQTPINILVLIILGAILGMVGQGLRVVVGIKKLGDQASNEKKDQKNLFETQQLVLSLIIAFAVGAIAGVLAAVTNINTEFSTSLIFTFIAAGYAGTDFIEGFMRKNSNITKSN